MSAPTSNCQVVILAAGKGIRMRSELPKVLHKVCGRTLVHRAVAAAAGIHPKRIVLVLGYGAPLVREEIARVEETDLLRGIELSFVMQTEQLGTGHAVQMALPKLRAADGPVLVMPGDCPLISSAELDELLKEYVQNKDAIAFLSALVLDPTGFGRVVRNKAGDVTGVVEEKDCTDEQRKIQEINSSIYAFDCELLNAGLGTLKPANAQGEFYLTDMIDFAAQKKAIVDALCLPDPDAVLGANSRAELCHLEAKRRAEINWHWMEMGVTLEDPACTYIDEDAVIGADSYLGAGTKLRGKTVLGEKVVVDGNCMITDSKIGAGTHIKLSSVIESSEVGPACEIGPFARLRPDSRLHENVKIGNFVETKKAEIHAGAKASHLSYLGDITIGGKVNVGAGTIICNYDGVNKHRTEIGSNTFVGSNSCLVAPVKVGDDAYIAAGSTITEDVPSGALGIARGRQENKIGWAAKRKTQKHPK